MEEEKLTLLEEIDNLISYYDTVLTVEDLEEAGVIFLRHDFVAALLHLKETAEGELNDR